MSDIVSGSEPEDEHWEYVDEVQRESICFIRWMMAHFTRDCTRKSKGQGKGGKGKTRKGTGNLGKYGGSKGGQSGGQFGCGYQGHSARHAARSDTSRQTVGLLQCRSKCCGREDRRDELRVIGEFDRGELSIVCVVNDTTGSVTLMETGELNKRRADRLDGFFRIGKIVAKRQTSNRRKVDDTTSASRSNKFDVLG